MESNVQIDKKLIVIQGPTASGKTQLSIDLAKHFKTVIFSADSRQFYREMSIGTAKPSLAEQDGIRHFFIDSHAIQEEITAAQFAKEANKLLEEQFKIHDVIVLTGGSGMFVDALLNGLDNIPTDAALRQQLMEESKLNGIETLVKELIEKDPEYARQVDQSNPARIIRAIEAIRLTGEKFSTLRTGQVKERGFSVARFIIDIPRAILYNRINLRVDQMMKSGLMEEAKSLLPYRNLTSLQTVGYKEFFEYFDGHIPLEKAIELVKQHSRNYAKRQVTWLKRYDDGILLEFGDTMLSTLLQKLKENS